MHADTAMCIPLLKYPGLTLVGQAACGTTSSLCTMVGEQLVSWGKLKASGDNTMVRRAALGLAPPSPKTLIHETLSISSPR
jgi:hypothetical protein